MTKKPALDTTNVGGAETLWLLDALRSIADSGCDCTGYYKCNNCPSRMVRIAEEALGRWTEFYLDIDKAAQQEQTRTTRETCRGCGTAISQTAAVSEWCGLCQPWG
jgi:hypothetical protein